MPLTSPRTAAPPTARSLLHPCLPSHLAVLHLLHRTSGKNNAGLRTAGRSSSTPAAARGEPCAQTGGGGTPPTAQPPGRGVELPDGGRIPGQQGWSSPEASAASHGATDMARRRWSSIPTGEPPWPSDAARRRPPTPGAELPAGGRRAAPSIYRGQRPACGQERHTTAASGEMSPYVLIVKVFSMLQSVF
jgi:hypothetical protein